MNNKKHKIGIIVFTAIIALAVVFAVLNATLKLPVVKPENKTHNSILNITKYKNSNYIAALYINGVIEESNMTYNQKWLISTINELRYDKSNKGIAIFINSPGGGVYESDETYLALQEYKTTGKPVYVYQGVLAASGGYYISCAGNKIYANRNTLTGSIGIIMGTSVDLTELMKKIGIKSETITSGRNKNMFNYNQPVTDEQRSIMRSIADEAYEQFTGIVAMNRNIPIFEVKKLADGRIYTAKQALHLNLVDAIGTWDGMLKDMADECFDGYVYETKDFQYNRKMTLRDYIINGTFGGDSSTAKKVDKLFSEASMHYPAFIYTGN